MLYCIDFVFNISLSRTIYLYKLSYHFNFSLLECFDYETYLGQTGQRDRLSENGFLSIPLYYKYIQKYIIANIIN